MQPVVFVHLPQSRQPDERGTRNAHGEGDGIRTTASSLSHASSVLRSGHNGRDRRTPPKKFVCLRRRHGRWPSARCDKPPTPEGRGNVARQTDTPTRLAAAWWELLAGLLGDSASCQPPGGSITRAQPCGPPVCCRLCRVLRVCKRHERRQRYRLSIGPAETLLSHTNTTPPLSTVTPGRWPVVECHSACEGTGRDGGCCHCCGAVVLLLLRIALFRRCNSKDSAHPQSATSWPSCAASTRFSPRDALDPSWSASRQQRRDRS